MAQHHTPTLVQAMADPTYVGHALVTYRMFYEFSEAQLTAQLDLPVERWTALCVAPRPRLGPGFDRAVRRLAEQTGCRAAALRDVLVEALILPPPAGPVGGIGRAGRSV